MIYGNNIVNIKYDTSIGYKQNSILELINYFNYF